MSTYTAVPNWLFSLTLTPNQKWLYVCLNRLCAQQADGTFVGNITHLAMSCNYPPNLIRDSDIHALNSQGLINARKEINTPTDKYRNWHISIPAQYITTHSLASRRALLEGELLV